MSLIVCPGSFDPLTMGHVDVIRRARDIFGEVIVGVAENSAKNYMFSLTERVELARVALADLSDVEVVAVPGLLADFAKESGAVAIVKGVRGEADFISEKVMALANQNLSSVETVFMLSDPKYAHVASSIVKDIAKHGGDVRGTVPANVAQALENYWKGEQA